MNVLVREQKKYVLMLLFFANELKKEGMFQMTRLAWPTLILVLTTVRRYIQRNQTRLQSSLDSQQYQCVVAVLDAVLTCLAALPANTPGS